ncbi:hypothetical protein Syun_009540 [Stephania yunnanensis]|uniref:Uncharacterized protein n=1 Tax=Stephania yunnanensis TaxID=152371 RepID=A0AAP0KEP3_9MAGN
MVEFGDDTPFQRVKVDRVEFIDDRLQDNSSWAKVSWRVVITPHFEGAYYLIVKLHPT